MAFPLSVADGYEARDLNELKAHFDLAKIVEYFQKGRLQCWLEKNYSDEADEVLRKIETLSVTEDDFVEKLTAAFGVTIVLEEINTELIIEQSELKDKLRCFFSADNDIEDILERTADSQEKLEELLNAGKKDIYLFSDVFVIPRTVHNVSFEGVKNPRVQIQEKNKNLLLKQKLRFKNVEAADEENRELLECLANAAAQKTEADVLPGAQNAGILQDISGKQELHDNEKGETLAGLLGGLLDVLEMHVKKM